MKYEIASGSRIGSRRSNQDRVGVAERTRSVLLVLADGLGGHEGGEIAAAIAVETLLDAFRRLRAGHIANPPGFLSSSLVDAHRRMQQQGARHWPRIEPRTTCVTCLVQDGYAYWAHVGDSRLYHFRGQAALTRTLDDTEVEHLRLGGVLTEEEMSGHPDKGRLLKCLGGHEPPDITLGPETRLHYDDTLLLCSDGLWEAFDTQELSLQLRSSQIEEAIEDLLEQAEDRMGDRCDNTSAICFRWREARALAEPLGIPRVLRTAPRTHDEPPRRIEEYGVDEAIAELEELVRRHVPKSRD
ncbi:MAG: PP2C family protein-serine/threonine phosphatase [Acidiferrobacteraceae bacterium]